MSSLITKFGTAKLHHTGYYVIKTREKGNHNKALHRLIYEDFWGVKLPKEIHVHHKDGNKTNNCILNLEAMTMQEHVALHNSGEKLSIKSRKISNAKNTSGYYRVSKLIHPQCKQGFTWRYVYYEDDKQKAICSVSFEKLEQKVKSKGLEWFKLSEMEALS